MSKQYTTTNSSHELMVLREALSEYLPLHITAKIKDKRLTKLQAAYKPVFDLQYEAIALISTLEMSYFIAMNELILEWIEKEWVELLNKLKELKDKMKDLNQYSELKGPVDNLQYLMRVGKNIYADIEYLSSTYEFEADAKAIVKSIKEKTA